MVFVRKNYKSVLHPPALTYLEDVQYVRLFIIALSIRGAQYLKRFLCLEEIIRIIFINDTENMSIPSTGETDKTC